MRPSVTDSIWLYLAVWLGYVSAGWLLAAFEVPWWVWLGTEAIILHLIKAGAEAIAVASAWIVVVISVAAVVKAWTPVWDSRIPFEHAQLWAGGLLFIWFWALGLVLLLAFAHKLTRLNGFRTYRFKLLLLLTGAGLGTGWFVYHVFS
jgi:magnesium-transporting ATPase (P-type)